MTKDVISGLPEPLKYMMTSLRRCAWDDAAQESMTESSLSAVKFDKFSKYYCKQTGVKRQPKTNDALYKTCEGKWYFIEFKNGTIKKDEIYRKIYDSLIMLQETDILPDFSYARNHIAYLLVYNKDKILQEKQIEKSEAKNVIHRHMEKKAETIFCLFELEKLKGYLFFDVQTYTKEQFDSLFVKKYEIEEGVSV